MWVGLFKEQEDEEASTGSHLKLIVDAFIQQLPNCVNRDLIDKVNYQCFTTIIMIYIELKCKLVYKSLLLFITFWSKPLTRMIWSVIWLLFKNILMNQFCWSASLNIHNCIILEILCVNNSLFIHTIFKILDLKATLSS